MINHDNITFDTLDLTSTIAKIQGEVTKGPYYSHEAYGECFYKMQVSSRRASDYIDNVLVVIPERANVNVKKGQHVSVIGDFRSYNEHDEKGNHLRIFIFAKKITILDEVPSTNENVVGLDGYICKPPIYRKTPKGREIADVLLAVNQGDKSYYIPCIIWGRDARYVKKLPVSQELKIIGRIQSREYCKGNQLVETYEVSVRCLKEV